VYKNGVVLIIILIIFKLCSRIQFIVELICIECCCISVKGF